MRNQDPEKEELRKEQVECVEGEIDTCVFYCRVT